MAMTMKRPSVVVIGAGMAGLSAAAQLSDSGLFNITVLEAMDRPGGRIHSTWQMGNTVLELGANWIHGSEGNPVYQVAAKNNLLQEDDESSSDSSSEDSAAEWYQKMDDYHFFMEDGTQVSRQIAKDAISFYSSLLEQMDPLTNIMSLYDEKNVGEYLDRLVDQKLRELNLMGPATKVFKLVFSWCMRQECMDNGCQSLKDVSLARFKDYKALAGEYYCTLGSRGYQGVLDVLLEKIPTECMKYNAAMAKIEWNYTKCSNSHQTNSQSSGEEVNHLNYSTESMRTKPVVITCENGNRLFADHVIVTASVGYLKRNHSHLFYPALPDDKQRTLDILQFGTINKIFLQYKKPFWKQMFKKDFDGIQLLWDQESVKADENGTGVSEKECERNFVKKILGFDTVEKHSNVLVGWIYGKEAEYMETLDDKKIGQVCTSVLRQFLKNPKIPEPTTVLCTHWHSNPYVCGSYGSFVPPEATGNEYRTMLEPVYGLKYPEDKDDMSPLLLFAGEAYHKEYQSTTHGAMVTGISQADRLIDLYKNTTSN